MIRKATKQEKYMIEIGHAMLREGLTQEFVSDAVTAAFEYEGVQDLMYMWLRENSQEGMALIIDDIVDLIEDINDVKEHKRLK
jgi:hypothetical protein